MTITIVTSEVAIPLGKVASGKTFWRMKGEISAMDVPMGTDGRLDPVANKRSISDYLRYITVEPALCGSMVIIAMYTLLGRQYIYSETAKKYGVWGGETNETCGSSVNTSDPLYQLQAKVSAETSNWILYLGIATFATSTISTTILGPWSDVVGRKVPMLMGLTGLLFLMTVYIFVINFNLPIPVLLLGHLVCGLLGDFSMVIATSYSHIADITEENRRTFRIAVGELILGISALVANIAGGIWADFQGFKNPFWLLFAIAVFDIIYASIRFESTMKGSLLKNLKNLVALRPLARIYAVVKWKEEGNNRRRSILMYTACYFMVVLVLVGVQNVMLVYEIGVPFCWDYTLAGFSAGLAQCANIVSLILIRIFRGLKAELVLVMVGVVANFAFCTTIAVAKMTWHIFFAQCFQLFSTVISPVLMSQMSRLVSKDEVGSIFGLVEATRNIAALSASFVFNGIFSATVDTLLPGAAFLVGNGVYVIFIILYWITFEVSKSAFQGYPIKSTRGNSKPESTKLSSSG